MQDKGTGTVVVLHIRIVDRVNCNFCDLLKGKASNGMERTEERSQVPGAVRLYAAAAVHVVDLGPPFLRLEGTYMVPYTFFTISFDIMPHFPRKIRRWNETPRRAPRGEHVNLTRTSNPEMIFKG